MLCSGQIRLLALRSSLRQSGSFVVRMRKMLMNLIAESSAADKKGNQQIKAVIRLAFIHFHRFVSPFFPLMLMHIVTTLH